jgi:hypothetical protein
MRPRAPCSAVPAFGRCSIPSRSGTPAQRDSPATATASHVASGFPASTFYPRFAGSREWGCPAPNNKRRAGDSLQIAQGLPIHAGTRQVARQPQCSYRLKRLCRLSKTCRGGTAGQFEGIGRDCSFTSMRRMGRPIFRRRLAAVGGASWKTEPGNGRGRPPG